MQRYPVDHEVVCAVVANDFRSSATPSGRGLGKDGGLVCEVSCSCQPAGGSWRHMINPLVLSPWFQGGLDLLYLSSRYEKGKDAVAKLMSERHVANTYKQLNMAHGEIVSKQAELGPTTFPG